MNASPRRIRSLLTALSMLGILAAFLSSSSEWLPSSISNSFASPPPNGGFATLRGVVRIETKIQPRGHAINFYSRRGGPAVPPKPAAPINELESVVLYLDDFKAVDIPFPRRPPGVEPTIRQVNETFVPQMLAIQTGETVRFPNDDPFFHNVFSLSGARSFDLGRYPKNQVRSVKFDRPGIVKVFCHIHSHMNAVIRIFDHPYFCRAGSDGTFSIAQVPEGIYTIVAWHERLKPQRQVIRVQPGENVSIDFVL